MHYTVAWWAMVFCDYRVSWQDMTVGPAGLASWPCCRAHDLEGALEGIRFGRVSIDRARRPHRLRLLLRLHVIVAGNGAA